MPLTIVFVERKNRCNEVAAALQEEGIPAAALHGGLSQVGGMGSPAGQLRKLVHQWCKSKVKASTASLTSAELVPFKQAPLRSSRTSAPHDHILRFWANSGCAG
jgi:hypothetical protein